MKWVYWYFRCDHNWIPRGPFASKESAQEDGEKHNYQFREPIEVPDDWVPWHELSDH